MRMHTCKLFVACAADPTYLPWFTACLSLVCPAQYPSITRLRTSQRLNRWPGQASGRLLSTMTHAITPRCPRYAQALQLRPANAASHQQFSGATSTARPFYSCAGRSCTASQSLANASARCVATRSQKEATTAASGRFQALRASLRRYCAEPQPEQNPGRKGVWPPSLPLLSLFPLLWFVLH